MSQEKTKRDKKRTIDTLWMIVFVLLVVGSITNNIPKLQVFLAEQVELQDYYMNFLKPAIYGKINLLYAIIVAVCGLVYFNAATDISVGLSDRSVIHIKNISIVITTITGGLYGAVGILYFKSISVITIVIGLMMVLAVVSLVSNMIECSRLDKGESLSAVLKPVIGRLMVILAAMVVGGVLFLKPLPEKIEETDKYYNKLYDQLVRISFGHMEDVETNRALVKYEFVRRYSDSDREYDLEQLKAEYGNYMSGEGDWSNLWYFCHDSIDIELESQQIAIYKEFYPYHDGPAFAFNNAEILYEYFNIKGRSGEEKMAAMRDKLGDLEFFCICVEEELNSKWLTMRQEGDSSGGGFEDQFSKLDYNTATKDEIIAACDSFEANVESEGEGQVEVECADILDISMEVNVGKPWQQSTVVEKHGYAIGGCYMEIYDDVRNKYVDVLDGDSIVEDADYIVTLYVKLPTHTKVAEHVDASIEGVNAYYIMVKDYNDEHNYIEVEFRFTTKALEDTIVDSITVGYNHIRPDYHMYDVKPYDSNPICTIDSMEWSVYDVETGVFEPYTADTFAEENLCYVAAVKIIPDADVTFKEVENVNIFNDYFFEEEFSVPEYDEKLHKYIAGSYPKAYYEKHIEGDEEYIMLYLPYYRAETKGEDPRGDVYSVYGLGRVEKERYIYVIEGSKVKIEETSAIGAEVVRYEVKKTDGTIASTDEVNVFEDPDYYHQPAFVMPAYPIEITGYY